MANRRGIVFALASLGAASAAYALRPTHRAAEDLLKVDLERQVPLVFDGWSVDKSIVPILPNPELQSRLDAIYTQVLARTYVNADGQRVMLTVAYGSDQGSDATSVHRPEFCYSAQGFAVTSVGETRVPINGSSIAVRRLIGTLGARVEPITYWVTMNDRALLPGAERKMQQILLGLRGQIPDGMLVRVSTIGSALQDGFAAQAAFLQDMSRSMQPAVRARYFGEPQA